MSTHAGTDAGALFTLDPTRTYPVLERADGIRVWDSDGREYLDAIAGIAVANIGYGRQEVVDAIADQAARMPYAVSNIFATEPAIALAERIARLTPGDLDHVIFTSGGSEAVEVALKMARHYHVLRGEPDRSVFVWRWTNYHGATLGDAHRRRLEAPAGGVRADAAPDAARPDDLLLPLPMGPDAHPDCGACCRG